VLSPTVLNGLAQARARRRLRTLTFIASSGRRHDRRRLRASRPRSSDVYPQHLKDLASRIANDGMEHYSRLRDIRRVLQLYTGATPPYPYLRPVTPGTPEQAASALARYAEVVRNLTAGYADMAHGAFDAGGRSIAAARAAMNALLDEGERLAAAGIGIRSGRPRDRLAGRSAPVRDGLRAAVLIVDGSRVYAIDPALDTRSTAPPRRARGRPRAAVLAGIRRHGLHARHRAAGPPLRSLSLAVARSATSAAEYCYAQGGGFGEAREGDAVGRRRGIGATTVRPGAARRTGEPRVPRRRAADQPPGGPPGDRARGADRRRRRGPVGFAITTNGTLLRPDDAEFFASAFAVTVSLRRGSARSTIACGPSNGGSRHGDRRIKPLLDRRGAMQVTRGSR
jgi:hypothetical protein